MWVGLGSNNKNNLQQLRGFLCEKWAQVTRLWGNIFSKSWYLHNSLKQDNVARLYIYIYIYKLLIHMAMLWSSIIWMFIYNLE